MPPEIGLPKKETMRRACRACDSCSIAAPAAYSCLTRAGRYDTVPGADSDLVEVWWRTPSKAGDA